MDNKQKGSIEILILRQEGSNGKQTLLFIPSDIDQLLANEGLSHYPLNQSGLKFVVEVGSGM